MTPRAEQFLKEILKDLPPDIARLDLSLKQLVQEALDENKDLFTYLKAIESKLNEIS